jgi:hypothetical protein
MALYCDADMVRAIGTLPDWASDGTIEARRSQWFAAADEAQRRDFADKI